jgi:DNA-binding NarL/FixJ family response regulator
MRVKVIIVEDSRIQSETLERTVRQIPAEDLASWGIDAFDLLKARSVTSAKTYLDRAAADNAPFHVMLLDMGLPMEDTDKTEDMRNGLQVIEHANACRAVQKTVVLSIYTDYELIKKAFKAGVADYVYKQEPDYHHAVQILVLAAWDRILREECDRILLERFKELVPYGDLGLFYRLSACFSSVLQAVHQQGAQLRQEICERHGLHPEQDTGDPLLRRLAEIQRISDEARLEWGKHEKSLNFGKPEPQDADLRGILEEVAKTIQFALVARQVRLHLPSEVVGNVVTFEDDVARVIKEIVLGGIVELPGSPRRQEWVPVQVSYALLPEEQRVRLSFEDYCRGNLNETAEAINGGYAVLPQKRFGRDWGLSIAQLIALRGGGRIEVVPKEDGNVIHYYIPAHLS